MPNNFRLTGNVYVSKEGNDANSGLTPELPKLTVQAGLNATAAGQTLVIGAGVYNEPNIARTISTAFNIIADGHVVLQGDNVQSFTLTSTSGVSYIFNIVGIELRDFRFIHFLSNSANITSILQLTNCVLKNCVLINNTNGTFGLTAMTWLFNKCVLINCSGFFNTATSPTYTNLYGFENSVLINWKILPSFIGTSTVYSSHGIHIFRNSYLDSQSTLYVVNNISVTNFNFNNIQGRVIMNTNGAVSGANSNGVAQSFAAHRIDYPTYNVNSISADPLFNDVQNLNFTLQATSPHIRAASDFISNIGGTEYAVYMKASDAELTSGATVSNLTLQGNNSYVITAPNTTGSIISAPKLLQWPRTKPLTRLEWVGSLEFNKSVTAGTQGNQNVPDYETATSGAAAQPDRLCIKMRFSTQQTQPSTSGEWDNDGLWTAGEYRLFEINSKPKVDVNGIGNGSSSYVEFTGLGDIVPSWIQIDVILINNYNP